MNRICVFIGISKLHDDVLDLGGSQHSFSYGCSGTFHNSRKIVKTGENFGVGDTIVCAVDLESQPASISFLKNNKSFCLESNFEAGDDAYFPHVMVKNVIVEMAFSHEDGLTCQIGYLPWSSALKVKKENGVCGPAISDPNECEVIMMVGLPASGKTTVAEEIIGKFPDKRFMLLGTSTLIEQMQVPGLPRVEVYAGNYTDLMKLTTQMLDTLMQKAAVLYRNYIFDHTNVDKNTRMSKLAPFKGYSKKQLFFL